MARDVGLLPTFQNLASNPAISSMASVMFRLTSKNEICKDCPPPQAVMSLIPSESYSFPDHFTSTVVPSRRQKKEKAQKKPEIVALPDPEPEIVALPNPEADFFAEKENDEVTIEPVKVAVAPVPLRRPPAPNPALRRANAPPPRIPDTPPVKKIALPPTLKPKVRWNNRAPAIDPAPMRSNGLNGNGNGEAIPAPLPAQNVIPMKVAKPPRPPQTVPLPAMMKPPPPLRAAPPSTSKVLPVQKAARPVQAPVAPPPKPKPAAPAPAVNSQADLFEMFAEDGYAAAARRRKQMKLRRFIACEAAVLAVLLPLVILGLTVNVSSPGLRWIMNIFTIAAAVTAAVIPIMFYAFTPTLPELER